MTNLTSTKSLLAKLLATENVTVEHGKYQTASFDVKNRVLRLPIWKEMSGSLYDLMVLHEVGLALYTPEDGWHERASKKGNGYKSFLNVVEDARIERKIKDKYPGGRRSFTEGYLDLMNKDFFGINGLDVNELGLIDRINLYFKGGTLHDISFNNEEREFIDKVANTRTWDDVVRVTDELFDYAKDHESETDMSDHGFSEFSCSEEGEEGESEMEDWDSAGESPFEMDSDDSDNEPNDNIESGEGEKKEEDSGSSSGTGKGEGEDEDVESVSSSDAGKAEEDDGEATSAKSGDSDGSENSNDANWGSGAGVGSPFDDEGSIEPRSITDDNFRSRETELVEESSDTEYKYATLPNVDVDNVIIDYKEIHSKIRKHYEESDNEIEHSNQLKEATEGFVSFRNKNKKTVEYLAKEFEMKKAANAHSRTATANSGIIDTGMLHEYKYNEHIFKKINVTADGKNHGLVMVVDWSGAMGNNIKGTLEQMITLVMFCKRVNIPFEAFLFSDSYRSEIRGRNSDGRGECKWTHKSIENGDLMVAPHHLLNVFSSRMRAAELHTAYVNMTAIASAYDRNNNYGRYYTHEYRTIPNSIHLGGTPLNDSLLAINTFLPIFKAKNNVQIVNLIYLTDGDSSSMSTYWNIRTEYNQDGTSYEKEYSSLNDSNYGSSKKTKIIIRDKETKKEYQLGSGSRYRNRMTQLLVEVLRDKHNINVVNFFLIPRMRRHDWSRYVDYDIVEDAFKYWKKHGHYVAPGFDGWTELYLVKGGQALEVEEAILSVKEDAKKGDIKRAFSKFSKGKLENRMMLSKFVDMVAV